MCTRLETAEHLRTLSALVLDHLKGVETHSLRERAALACLLEENDTYRPQ